MNLNDLFTEEKVRLDPKCWTGKKIGNPKTKMKGGTRVNNCVPAESVNEMDKSQTPPGRDGSNDSDAGKKEYTAKATTPEKVAKHGEKILNKVLNKKKGVAEGSLEEIDRRGFLKGLGAAAVAGAAGSAMAQSRPVDVSREFQNMRQDDPRVQHNKDIEEMARAIYEQIVATRGQPIDRRQQQMWMTIAREKATEKLSKYAPGRPAPQSQSLGFPSQGSERRVSRNIDNFESQGVAEGELDEGWKSALGAAALAGTMAMGAGGASARVMPGDDPGINRLTGKPIATQQATDTAPAKAEAPQGFSKEYLQKAANPDRFGRFLISVEKAQELLKQMNEGVAEEAPPGDKAERMVRHIKKSYAKDGKITDKEKGIAYATAWKAHNSGKLEEQNMSDEQATLQAKLQELEKQYDPSFEYSDDYRVWTQQKGIQNQINSIKQQLARLNETAPKEKEADYGDDYQAMVARVKKLAGLGPLKTVYDPNKRVYRNVPTAVQPKK